MSKNHRNAYTRHISLAASLWSRAKLHAGSFLAAAELWSLQTMGFFWFKYMIIG